MGRKMPFLLCALFLCAQFAWSQALLNESKIIEFLGLDRYNQLKVSDPGLIRYLDAKASYGYQVVDVVNGKEADFKYLSSIPVISKSGSLTITPEEFLELFESGNLNILLYDLPSGKDNNAYFQLGHTGKAIVIFSTDYVNSKITQ